MCKCLLKLINDQSSDVQSLAVKCLSPLVRKVHEERVEEIMVSVCSRLSVPASGRVLDVGDSLVSLTWRRLPSALALRGRWLGQHRPFAPSLQLCTNVLSGTEEQRDICSIGLKTVVLEMPGSMACTAIRHLTPQLIRGVQRMYC